MSNERLASELATELFDLVQRYSSRMTASELIGVLELHKQELVHHHFNQIKKEMENEARKNICGY